jgi:hypothetical protein
MFSDLPASPMRVEIGTNDFLIDAKLLADLLRLEAEVVHALLRTQEITSFCERGVDEHEGQYRLSFFYGNRRARLHVDAAGNVTKRSVIDFRQVALPRQLHRAGG